MAAGNYECGGQSVRSSVMESAQEVAGETPTPQLRSLVCPYCGSITPDTGRCGACAGRFDPLSRQATQNQMGPWSIRDDRLPFRPGCTYETLVRLAQQGKISSETILRGPSTHQFWTLARHTPGVAHLLGVCHSCQSPVDGDGFACPICHASFSTERDRQHLGLGPSRPLPGQGLPEVLALHAEPASQHGTAETHNGVVSTPIGTAGIAQAQSHVGGTTDQQSGGVNHRHELDEATRNARQWRAAWRLERRRAWVILIIMGTITLIAIAYAILGAAGMIEGDSNQATDQNSELISE